MHVTSYIEGLHIHSTCANQGANEEHVQATTDLKHRRYYTQEKSGVLNPTVAEAVKFIQLRRELCDAYEAFTEAAQKVVDSVQFVTVENCTEWPRWSYAWCHTWAWKELTICDLIATDIVPVSFLNSAQGAYVARIVKA